MGRSLNYDLPHVYACLKCGKEYRRLFAYSEFWRDGKCWACKDNDELNSKTFHEFIQMERDEFSRQQELDIRRKMEKYEEDRLTLSKHS